MRKTRKELEAELVAVKRERDHAQARIKTLEDKIERTVTRLGDSVAEHAKQVAELADGTRAVLKAHQPHMHVEVGASTGGDGGGESSAATPLEVTAPDRLAAAKAAAPKLRPPSAKK